MRAKREHIGEHGRLAAATIVAAASAFAAGATGNAAPANAAESANDSIGMAPACNWNALAAPAARAENRLRLASFAAALAVRQRSSASLACAASQRQPAGAALLAPFIDRGTSPRPRRAGERALPAPVRQGEAPAPSAAVAPLSDVRAVAGETLEPASSPSTPSAWKTDEYNRSSGSGASRLNLINAAEGYARRVTGRVGGGGITVAVIDDGIDAGHAQLDVAGAFDSGSAGRRHGTQMAGVIAARRDGEGIHGVAFNANLISLGRTAAEANFNAAASDIASAAGLARVYGTYRSNPAASAHILNMSWGTLPRRRVPVIQSAMRDAAGAGRIMVASLGNAGGVEPRAAPAVHVADEGIAGFAIAAGWLNQAGTARHDSANNCGAVARYCLFAPGTKVLTTSTGANSERTSSGSSHSTAYVSGSAAVVWAAFPNKRGDQVVGRLLSTARPLDGAEISSTYGHGALDLGAAMNPVGFLSLSLNGGGGAALASSFIELPPAFALPARDDALASAVVYDRQMFPFLADLNAVFRTARRPPFWWLPEQMSDAIGLRQSNGAGFRFRPASAHVDRRGAGRLAFRPTPQLALAFGAGADAIDALDGFFSGSLRRNPLLAPFAATPFAAFAGRGKAVSLGWQVDRRIALHFTGRRGDAHPGAAGFGAIGAAFASAGADLAAVGIASRIGAATFSASYGVLDERESLLGLRASGAFNGLRDAETAFLNLRFEARLTHRATLFGSLSRGVTAAAGQADALIAGWGETRSQSFLLGGRFDRLYAASDRLTFTASMPLRARRARLYLDVPDREVADGVVRYARRAVNLSPDGRELQLQLAYAGTALAGRLDFALGANLHLQPNHRAGAAPEFGAAMSMRLTF